MSLTAHTITGVVASVTWEYFTAAAINGYVITCDAGPPRQWSVVATVVLADAFKMTRSPLMFVAPIKGGQWRFPIVRATLADGRLHAELVRRSDLEAPSMSSRMRKPETVKIDLTRDDWILVKKWLTAGEQRQIFARMLRRGVRGSDEIDTLQVGLAKMIGYLLDWSFTDADDQPLVIREQPEETVAAILLNLDADAFTEVLKAVETHEAAMDRIRAAEKNGQGGEMKSSAISPSAEPLAGATNGSLNSTGTSTAS